MSVKRIVNLPNISGWSVVTGVASTAHTVTLDVPVGPRYHVIWIRGSAGTATYKMADLIGEIRIKINGKVQRVATADEINKLNQLNGAYYAAQGGGSVLAAGVYFYLPIFFAEPWRKNVATQDGLAWSTKGLSTFQIEIYIKGGTTFTAPLSLAAKACVDNSDRELGAIVKWFYSQIPVNAVSTWHDFMGFPKRDFYQQISFVDGNLDEFEVKVDNNVIRQDTILGNVARLINRELTPAPSASGDTLARGMVDIVFDDDDVLNSALPMEFNGNRVQDFNVRLLTGSGGTAARTIKAIYQVIGPAE